MADVDFKAMLAADNVPVESEELSLIWQNELAAQGSPITNDSKYSPFRKLIDAIMVAPAKTIVDAMINTTLPAQFLMTAKGDALLLKGEARLLSPLSATKAQGVIDVNRTLTDTVLVIEAGFVLQSPAINGVNYAVVTTEQLTLSVGVATGQVAVEAVEVGSAYNLAAGYYNVQVAPIDDVTMSNGNAWLTQPGTDDETDDDFRLRVKNQFNLVGDYHIDAVYKGMLAEQFGIRTSDIFIQHNAPRGPGTANCYILLPIGNASPEFIASINEYITDEGNHGHGDDVQVFAIPETNHDVSVSVWPVSGLSVAEINLLQSNISSFIRAAFRENDAYTVTTTLPGAVFSFSRLTQELHSKFPKIDRLVFANGDIQSGLSIPRLSDLSVLMQ
ncbi:uncharacterized phage Mu protein GP47-like protein [Paraglaciecola sp. T6c]|uniref:baseplate J/gp47 family protein n=1 Tax=Pseudoalteromonas atlantica (strain T6c / ATCC BAA-1087) TaxID=3042615 RepID=UPI00005C6937|nr:baseplate J/gp47 family protein [Paraglaciecola sp. T6c]ABG39242.1 uncharacterized phage Mu protein GP47-like protein [Paraglaciecola sp. T6c]